MYICSNSKTKITFLLTVREWVMVGHGASLTTTLIGCSSSTTCSLSSCLKIYIYVNVKKSMGAWKTYLHVQIKLYYIEGQWIFQRKQEIHVPWGGEWWVSDDPNWVLFKHHSLTIKLNKVIYISMSAFQWGDKEKETM